MIAAELDFALVDTGLLYRAVTVEARRRGIAVDDAIGLGRLTESLRLELNTSPQPPAAATLVSANGRDVTREALDPAIASDLARISQVREVRVRLKARQRAYGAGNAVILGRDIGTVVFPEADVKFFLTASAAERVARRRHELESRRGRRTPDEVLEQEVEARDRADTERELSPLRPAPDAIIVETEGKSVHQVFQEVMAKLPAS